MQVFFLIILILLGFLLMLFCWMLFVRITVQIDTRIELYEMRIGKAIRIFFEPGTKRFFLSVFGWKKALDSFSAGEKKVKEEKAKPVRKKRKRMPLKKLLRKMRAVLKTFHVTRCELDFDSDDVITNAYLFPVFFFLSGKRVKLRVRYDGENAFVLEVNNRIVRILRAVLFG